MASGYESDCSLTLVGRNGVRFKVADNYETCRIECAPVVRFVLTGELMEGLLDDSRPECVLYSNSVQKVAKLVNRLRKLYLSLPDDAKNVLESKTEIPNCLCNGCGGYIAPEYESDSYDDMSQNSGSFDYSSDESDGHVTIEGRFDVGKDSKCSFASDSENSGAELSGESVTSEETSSSDGEEEERSENVRRWEEEVQEREEEDGGEGTIWPFKE